MIDVTHVPTPCYVVHEGALDRNLRVLSDVQDRTGCKIILALKGFAMWSTFPMIRRHLAGTTASSLNEARLGREEFGGEVHVYAPAYRDDEIVPLLELADHISFNSFSQWERHKPKVAQAERKVSCGLRINPQHSEVQVPLYDPCAPGSRLGITSAHFCDRDLTGIEGMHFHTLCELNADSLERTLHAVERRFGTYLPGMKWVNFGGGHHITRPDYELDLLCKLVTRFQEKYDVQVYLEPGEAVALHTGVLVSEVLDIVENELPIAILDTSASAHMPDVLEMPYRPEVVDAGKPDEFEHTYRLGGLTCLAGDVIGDYSFKKPLQVGDKLIFLDMAHYTMVKNTTFNGVPLPSIGLYHPETDKTTIVRSFGYEDYKRRLS